MGELVEIIDKETELNAGLDSEYNHKFALVQRSKNQLKIYLNDLHVLRRHGLKINSDTDFKTEYDMKWPVYHLLAMKYLEEEEFNKCPVNPNIFQKTENLTYNNNIMIHRQEQGIFKNACDYKDDTEATFLNVTTRVVKRTGQPATFANFKVKEGELTSVRLGGKSNREDLELLLEVGKKYILECWEMTDEKDDLVYYWVIKA